MTRRIATVAATLALFAVLPATATADEHVSVADGVLTYVSGDGTVDTATLFDGLAGALRLSETTSPSGTLGSGCTYIGSLTSSCLGATRASLETLDGDDVVLVEATAPATIDAGPGADTVTGGPADDTIEARDGEVDTIDCGAGTDTAYVDPVDVVSGCELPEPVGAPVTQAVDPAPVVEEPPAAEEPPVAPAELPIDRELAPPALGVLPASISQTEARVNAAGVTTLELACAPTEAAGCQGAVFLDPAPRGRKGRKKARAARRGRFGKAPFKVAAGTKARIRLRLSTSARRALGMRRGRGARAARRGRAQAVVTVAQRGRRPVKSRIRLKR